MKNIIFLLIAFPSFLISQTIDTLSIESKILKRTIDVLTIDYNDKKSSPIFYLTDGKKMIDNGTASMIDSLTNMGLIPESKFIFVSTIDPKTKKDYRKEYFFCNEDYALFFEDELIPLIEGNVRLDQERYLIGVSFGGMNAAFFAAKTNFFKGFAILSPITYPCEEINQNLIFSKNENYKIYISTGQSDAENYIESLLPILKLKTSKIKLINTKGGHDFKNWNNQMIDIINFMAK